MNATMKICTKCGFPKPIDDFYRDNRRKNGRQAPCKICHNKWAAENRESRRASCKKYDDAHRKEIKIRKDRYHVLHSDVDLAWRLANPEKIKSYVKKTNKKRRSTRSGKLSDLMASGIRHSIKGNKAGRHWEDLVGYTLGQLMNHLEKLFKPGMTWENYGKVWEIDHKIPKVVFNFQHPDHIDFRLCWSLKNLQPLEVSENRKKNAKLSKPFQPSLRLAV
jgi:hypothetical protein